MATKGPPGDLSVYEDGTSSITGRKENNARMIFSWLGTPASVRSLFVQTERVLFYSSLVETAPVEVEPAVDSN